MSKQEKSATKIYNANRADIVAITTEFDNNLGFGSGMIIGDGYILSNAHMVLITQKGKAKDYPNSISCASADSSVVDLDLIFAGVKKILRYCTVMILNKMALTFSSMKFK